jgi:thioesterase domain-containing protein
MAVAVAEPRGLGPGESPAETFEQIVSEALASVRHARKSGPFRLMGHSFGGRIAYEVARRLEADGHAVTLALLDSLPSDSLVDVSYPNMAEDDETLARWLQATSTIEPTRTENYVETLVREGRVSESGLRALLDMTKAQFRINRGFKPSDVLSSTRVRLFYATRSLIGAHPHAAILDDLRAWCPSATAVAMPGDHFSILRDGALLANQIAAWCRPGTEIQEAAGEEQESVGQPA